ncbi:MAG: DUF3105 domain-containing protein [Chloroflexi bacterium]|jgi:hypothetical protein|nr:DUF3105 domain-containing protein [Chloroflexota bacterium]
MNSKNRRQQLHDRQRKQKLRSGLTWGGIGVVVLAIIGLVIWQGVRPAAGESVQIMVSDPHIPVDSDPGQYNSDPPTSGRHYAEEARAGFFDNNNYQFPAGYLVHNLEHGYVIFWYNCDLLDESGCTNLKEQIKTTIDDLGGVKLIAYPWPSLDIPLVMTSWGRLQRFETFDAEQAKAFYRSNLNKAPEPDAP